MSSSNGKAVTCIPKLDGLTLREVWDIEDQLIEAKEAVGEFIDSEIRRLVEVEKWSQRKIAENVGRSQKTVSLRCFHLGIIPAGKQGSPAPRLIPGYQNNPAQNGSERNEPDVLPGQAVEIRDPVPEDKIRPSTVADLTAAPLPPPPIVEHLPAPEDTEAVRDMVKGWQLIRRAIDVAWEKERAVRMEHTLDDRLDGLLVTARELAARALDGDES